MANKVEIQIVGNNVYAVNAIDGVKTKLGTLEKSSKKKQREHINKKMKKSAMHKHAC